MSQNEIQHREAELKALREILTLAREQAEGLGVTVEVALSLRLIGVLNSVANSTARIRPVDQETMDLQGKFIREAMKQLEEDDEREWKP